MFITNSPFVWNCHIILEIASPLKHITVFTNKNRSIVPYYHPKRSAKGGSPACRQAGLTKSLYGLSHFAPLELRGIDG